MKELELMAAALAGTIEESMAELRKIDKIDKPLVYEHQLGTICAYEDVLNMVIWRLNELSKKEDK